MNNRLAGSGAPKRSASSNPFHSLHKRLRSGGRTDTSGAIPYLAEARALGRETALRIVRECLDLQHVGRHSDEPSFGG
jgi:hypothetical protein